MGLVGPRHCPACREVSSALVGACGAKHRPCATLLSSRGSVPCLGTGCGGHLCPSHLVAPDMFKKSPWCAL